MSEPLSQKLIQGLTVCGCTPEEIAQYQNVANHGTKDDEACFLKRHRRKLMEDLHEIQRQIDCVDYRIEQIKKGNENN